MDKGSGAARRSREAALAEGNFVAFLQRDGKWVEGRAAVVSGDLTFVSVGGETATLRVSSCSPRPGRTWRLARDRGFRWIHAHEVDLMALDQTQWLVAVGKRELPVLLDATD